MVLWHEHGPVTSLPARFQIPRGYCENGISNEYKLVYVSIKDEEFLEWFKNIEKTLCPEPYESRVKDGLLNVKFVEGYTQIFDESNNLTLSDMNFAGSELDCLIDVEKVYGPLNDKYGLVCKIFQVRVTKEKCLFT